MSGAILEEVWRCRRCNIHSNFLLNVIKSEEDICSCGIVADGHDFLKVDIKRCFLKGGRGGRFSRCRVIGELSTRKACLGGGGVVLCSGDLMRRGRESESRGSGRFL